MPWVTRQLPGNPARQGNVPGDVSRKGAANGHVKCTSKDHLTFALSPCRRCRLFHDVGKIFSIIFHAKSAKFLLSKHTHTHTLTYTDRVREKSTQTEASCHHSRVRVRVRVSVRVHVRVHVGVRARVRVSIRPAGWPGRDSSCCLPAASAAAEGDAL